MAPLAGKAIDISPERNGRTRADEPPARHSFARRKKPTPRPAVRAAPPAEKRPMASSVRDLYAAGLVNAHALENQAVQLLSCQVERLEGYPQMEQRMRQHIDESRRQAARLEEILKRLGTQGLRMKSCFGLRRG